jgi:hypothetical protein
VVLESGRCLVPIPQTSVFRDRRTPTDSHTCLQCSLPGPSSNGHALDTSIPCIASQSGYVGMLLYSRRSDSNGLVFTSKVRSKLWDGKQLRLYFVFRDLNVNTNSVITSAY